MENQELLLIAVSPVLGWYRLHKRSLPWRENRTPYRVLVSELMLQQTRVEAVKERYVLFLEQFPTAEALATASEDEVLKAWEGLGYYSRARNLHKAAKLIAENGFPETFAGVRALPGVGDYTAGAICSIALGLPTPAVDGNVLRILTRLLADSSNIDDIPARKRFSELLAGVYPPEAGEFTESLMELGATVCVPNGAPLCGECPWKDICRAHLAGRETEFPVRGEKQARKIVHASVYIYKSGEKYAIVKREKKGLLAGLYGFPFYTEGENAPAIGKVLATKPAKHIFTHVEWHMTGYLIEVEKEFPRHSEPKVSKSPQTQSELIWATAEEIHERYALPSAFSAFLEWVR